MGYHIICIRVWYQNDFPATSHGTFGKIRGIIIGYSRILKVVEGDSEGISEVPMHIHQYLREISAGYS